MSFYFGPHLLKQTEQMISAVSVHTVHKPILNHNYAPRYKTKTSQAFNVKCRRTLYVITLELIMSQKQKQITDTNIKLNIKQKKKY